jgi:biopolymer transport protein ExbB
MANLFVAGGIVMWPLLLFSLLTVTLVVERCWFWLRIIRQQRGLVPQVLSQYQQNPQLAIATLKKHKQLPMARIFLSAISLGDTTPEEFRLALESAGQAELPVLKRFQTMFETVVGVAPLLGLLGTVLGLIRVLSSIRLGSNAAEAPAGVTLGIGEALISTAAGLVVAIVALLFANLFQGLYRRQRAFIQEAGGKLEILHRQHIRQAAMRQQRY